MRLEPALHVERLGLRGDGFRRVVEARHDAPYFALLDSALSAPAIGRYSFACWDPFAVVRSTRAGVTVERRGGGAVAVAGGTLDALERAVGEVRVRRPEGEWPPFLAGAVGYLGYEVGAELERVPQALPDETGIPRALFALYAFVLAYDRERDETFLSYLHAPGAAPVPPLDDLRRSIHEAAAFRPSPLASARAAEATAPADLPRSDFTRDEYVAAARRIREYIRRGDVYQVNLTQRFSLPVAARDPWTIYARLREINPAPFGAYLAFDRARVLSSSPERFLRVEGRRVEARPMKGTAARGATPEDDAERARLLLASAKDRAELAMIVDLMRNDLGRVCEVGSVRVEAYPVLERYASVHQLVAAVSGVLRDDRSPYDLLRAAFPAGSVTGAPKIRAMEIIDEVERVQRGVYTGAMGYLGFDGAMDLNVAIRTIVVAGAVAHAHAGGGVVFESDEEAEYEESLLKARGLLRALGVEPAGRAASRTAG